MQNEETVFSVGFLYFAFVVPCDEIKRLSFLFPAVVVLYDHIIRVPPASSLYSYFFKLSIGNDYKLQFYNTQIHFSVFINTLYKSVNVIHIAHFSYYAFSFWLSIFTAKYHQKLQNVLTNRVVCCILCTEHLFG